MRRSDLDTSWLTAILDGVEDTGLPGQAVSAVFSSEGAALKLLLLIDYFQ